MLKFIFVFIGSFLVLSCADSTLKNKKTWVYLEVYNITQNDTTVDYVYGKLRDTDLEKIKSQSSSEDLFELTDGRYLDDNQIPHDFSEENETGSFLYRIKHITYLEIQKGDPLKFIKDSISK